MIKILLAAALLVSLPMTVLAQEEDAEGCKDSKLLTRMSGCTISECSAKEFDEMVLHFPPKKGEMEPSEKALEGATEIVTFACPAGKYSGLQIVRNAEGALKKAGFTVVWSGKGNNEGPEMTAQKANQYVMVETADWGGDGNGYRLHAVQVQKMEQQMEATADSLAEEITKSGRVAVYGINFDTGKATLQPGSDKILGEIAKLMKAQTDWKLKVEGHTDNVGAKTANKKLSEQRAAAVVTWLAANGVEKARLTSAGLGDTKPVADNGSDEGRAKNRRVDLVKQ